MRRTIKALRHSLRGRLLLGTLLWITVSVSVAGWALSDLFRTHLTRQLTSELMVHMNQLVAALSVDAQGKATLGTQPADPRLAQPYSGLYWQVDRLPPDDAQQLAAFHSRSLWDQTLQPPATGWYPAINTLEPFRGPQSKPMLALVRVVIPPEGADRYRLIVAVDQSVLEQPLMRFRTMAGVFLGLLAFGLIMAAFMQLVVGLRPLATLRQQLGNVRQQGQARIEGRFPSEVQPLVEEFNLVLKQNNDIVQRARAQAGNLAHALKTPLTVLSNAAAQDSSAFGRLVAEQVEFARRQVDHHLAQARAAAAAQVPGQRTVVQPLLDGIERVMRSIYADKGLQLHFDVLPVTAVFFGQAQDMQEMLGNLIDNACKWADRQVWVRVRLGVDHGAATLLITVEDDGPGLLEARREEIFQRGVRLDERKPGSGLGLAIVRDLAAVYGGSVQAFLADTGGLGVELRLPGSAA